MIPGRGGLGFGTGLGPMPGTQKQTAMSTEVKQER